MSEEVRDEVAAAFDLLVEELSFARDDLRAQTQHRLAMDQFDEARRLLDQTEQVQGLIEQARHLTEVWEKVGARVRVDEPAADKAPVNKSNLGRLERGVRTPEPAFRGPILTALVELGGTANIGDVLDRVEQRMRASLQPVDWEDLPSGSMARWRNTAQWARNSLVEDGLMEPSRERGVWAISEAGRAFLEDGSG